MLAMPEPSLLMSHRLTSVIDDLAQRIAAGSYRSEAEISQGIVKRVLHELDWPVFDVQVVAPEFKIGPRKADYALCHPPGKPSVLVEVKDLGKADGRGEKQLFEYCFHQGVPIAVLTDGRTWSFFFPAGQGSYEERRFARIDLVEEDSRHSATTLARYLDVADVRSGDARKRAERDYEAARFQKEASSKFASVWRKLLEGPEPVLLDLFSEEVENATRVRPDPERAAAFIRDQARVGGVPAGNPKRTPPKKEREVAPPPVPAPMTTDAVGAPSFTFQGQTETFTNGAEVFGAVFSKLASKDPDFCRRYSEQHSGRVRKYVARSRDQLYPGKPRFEPFSRPLPGGWWLATHCSNQDKLKRIERACQVAGVDFGHDLKVHIPVGSRQESD